MLTAKVIEGFCGSVLLKNFDKPAPIPQCHKEWWELCCLPDKYVAIAAPRGHAKSTAITGTYVLATVLFREHDFVLIVSDTEGQAVLFLNEIKAALTENEDIIELFGVEKLEKDAETDIIIRMKDGHRFRIMAKGSEQKVRGLKWRGRRPNLIVGDDLENDEIVMNPERREKFRRWVNGALLPCLSVDGKVRIVGTILHIDSFLENKMPRPSSKNFVREALKDTFKRKIGAWTSVKYRAHDETFEHILWPERFNEKWLKTERLKYVNDGQADLYNQEYLNYPIDESRALFRRADLIPMDYKKWTDIVKKVLPVHFFIGMDLAVSTKSHADYSAFVVVALDAENMMYVVEVIRKRMDSLEIVDTVFELYEKYHPEWFVAEKGTIDKAIGPFLEEEMFARDRFPTIEKILASTDKEQRAKSIAGRVRIHGVQFLRDDDWYPDFEVELTQFPRGQHDDQVDAFSNIGLALTKLVIAPTEEEREEEEYQEERERSGFFLEGRNIWTGY